MIVCDIEFLGFRRFGSPTPREPDHTKLDAPWQGVRNYILTEPVDVPWPRHAEVNECILHIIIFLFILDYIAIVFQVRLQTVQPKVP